MQKSKPFIISFFTFIFFVQSVSAISNVQHSVDGNKVTITYQGTPPFLINIRLDTNIGQSGGYIWAKTYSNSFTYDLGFAVNPSKKFYYGIKDNGWGNTNQFSLGTKQDGLIWPIGCDKGITCLDVKYPDIDQDGKSFNCDVSKNVGHEGTDIDISRDQMDKSVPVYAAADGEVLWVFDGKYDRCPDDTNPDCLPPQITPKAGESSGYTVCTDYGPYCGTGTGNCYWCFDGGNVVVIRHFSNQEIFATRYDHLKKSSISVKSGDKVVKGQKIGEVGSAGKSTNPHLHFEVWGKKGFYNPADPWAGPCGPNFENSLWINQP